jgi:exostosin family protein
LAPGLIKDGRAKIVLVKRWFNHTAEQKREYVNEILRSKFVLCPRGQGMATHRLFEVMQLGRIPVILADDWLAPIGPDWNSCSIRIREKEIRNIPSILQANQDRFESMALAARREWETWFAPDRRLLRMLGKIEQLQKERSSHQCDLRLRWRGRRVWRRESSWLRWAWNGVRRRVQPGST